jgi:hypothetical protein
MFSSPPQDVADHIVLDNAAVTVLKEVSMCLYIYLLLLFQTLLTIPLEQAPTGNS